MHLSLTLYLLAIPALLVFFVTSLVRANEIGKHFHDDVDPYKHGPLFWHVRRFGLCLVAGATTAWLAEPLWLWHTAWLYYASALGLLAGFAIDWITTPNMPPWWRYITGWLEGSGHVVATQPRSDGGKGGPSRRDWPVGSGGKVP